MRQTLTKLRDQLGRLLGIRVLQHNSQLSSAVFDIESLERIIACHRFDCRQDTCFARGEIRLRVSSNCQQQAMLTLAATGKVHRHDENRRHADQGDRQQRLLGS